jgi:hypothetical protein
MMYLSMSFEHIVPYIFDKRRLRFAYLNSQCTVIKWNGLFFLVEERRI